MKTKPLTQFRSTTARSRRLIAAVGVMAGLVGAGVALPSTMTAWHEYASNPVYAPGKAYYPSVLKEGDTYTMWSESAAGVQLATSTDGITWTTVGSSSGLAGYQHPLVKKIDNNYRIWYWDGTITYAIGAIRTATSTDGLTWTGDRAITQVGATVITGVWPNWNYGSYGPCDILYNSTNSATIVVPVDKASVWTNRYVMYYDGTTGNQEFTGLAVSNDGLNWQGYNGGAAAVLSPSANCWDSGYATYGTVIRESDNVFRHWYCGGQATAYDGIGYASSTDGINWTKDATPIFYYTDGPAWRANRTYTPMVIGNQMWFTGKDTPTGNYTIGYATGLSADAVTIGRAWGTHLRISVDDVFAKIAGGSTPYTLQSVTSRGGGAYVQMSGSYILFAPAGNTNSILDYTVVDSTTPTPLTVSNTITVTVTNAVSSVNGISSTGHSVTITNAGIPGYAYAVERSSSASDWSSATPVQTTNAPGGGVWTFTDSTPPNPSFYRLRQNN